MHPLLEDPWVAAQIEAAVAPYRKVWPPGAVEAFREEMAATLASNMALSVLLREANPKADDGSGEVRTLGAAPAGAATKAGRKAGTQ